MAQTSDQLCDAAYPLGAGWIRCAVAATQVWLYGCVHEHLVQRSNCPDHEPVPGVVGCRACFDAGHECEMTAVRRIS